MPFVAAIEVHLLLDDTAVVPAEGDERYLGGLRMHGTLFGFSEVCNSYFLQGINNCIVLINWQRTRN